MGNFAASLAGAVLFLIASPTAWVLAFPFIDVTRFTVFAFGVASSAALWFLVGRAIALRSDDWLQWLRRYGTVCVAWMAFNLVAFGVVASIVG